MIPIFQSIEKNKDENKNLAQLRDTLLPKLMSGELKLSEIKRNYMNEQIHYYISFVECFEKLLIKDFNS